MRGHFRARVYFAGHYASGMPVYAFEVINRSTGQVIARDDHCGLSKLHDEARRLVSACELSWSYGLRQKALRK